MAKKKNATRFPQGVSSLEQIEAQYADQWVLVEETHWNKRGQPLAGRVIAHSQEKKRWLQLVSNTGSSTLTYCSFSSMLAKRFLRESSSYCECSSPR